MIKEKIKRYLNGQKREDGTSLNDNLSKEYSNVLMEKETLSDDEIITVCKLFRGELAGYAITKCGKLYSLCSNKWIDTYDGPFNTKMIRMRRRNYYVHRLIAEAWLGIELTSRHRVVFKDNDKTNIHLDNLEVITASRCIRNSKQKGLSEPIDVSIRKARDLAFNNRSNFNNHTEAVKNISKQIGISKNRVRKYVITNKEMSKYTPWGVSIGDTVRVDNKNLKTYGTVGKITNCYFLEGMVIIKSDSHKNTIRTRFDNIKKVN